MPLIILTFREVAGLYLHRLLDCYNKGMVRCRLYYYTLEICESFHRNNILIVCTFYDNSSLITTVYLDILFTLCYRSIFTQDVRVSHYSKLIVYCFGQNLLIKRQY